MTRWAKVKPGDVVELKGKPWTVTAAKRKGDAVKVTVTAEGREHSAKVAAGDKVKRLSRALKPGESMFSRLLEEQERRERRAESPLLEAARRVSASYSAALEDLGVKPGAKFDKPADDAAGRNVEQILGGRLEAVKPAGVDAYAVSPVGVTTVRAHLAMFHGIAGSDQPTSDAEALAMHDAQHDGDKPVGAVQHWHAKRRPQ